MCDIYIHLTTHHMCKLDMIVYTVIIEYLFTL